MEVRVKLLSFNEPASDGSHIPVEVVRQYLESTEYKNAIASHKMLGTLTHRARNISTGAKSLNPGVKNTIGKDDMLLDIMDASPTHYITSLEIEGDGWLYANAKILDEESLDENAKQNIRRLKGLLMNGCLIGASAVILGYWHSTNSGDVLKKLVNIKSFDYTLNPSWKKAQVVSVTENGKIIAAIDEERGFSDTSNDLKYDGLKVKSFSDLSVLGADNIAKTSKIDNHFTVLKAKEFSLNSTIEEVGETISTKQFSAATIRERVRISKMSPRMRFRRLFIDYKQAVKAGNGVDPETLKTMKSLFATDILDIIKGINSDIISGKQINTLIGASSLGKNVRVAAQNLQMPYKYAMQEIAKTGKISPFRYKNIQDAYTEFIKAMTDEVFGPSPLPEGIEEQATLEEAAGGKKDVKK